MYHTQLLHQTHLTETDGKIILKCILQKQGQDNTVGVATRYGLDGPGIEIWWGARFVHLSRAASFLCNEYRVSFQGGKRLGVALTAHLV